MSTWPDHQLGHHGNSPRLDGFQPSLGLGSDLRLDSIGVGKAGVDRVQHHPLI